MKKYFPGIAIFMLLVLLLCSTLSCFYITTPDNPFDRGDQNGGTSEPSSTAQANPPIINSFSFSPGSIEAGETSTLSWKVTGATTVTIDQGLGSVALNGSRVVSPPTTMLFKLLATNSAGSVTATAQIVVASPAPPPAIPNLPAIDTFAVDPDTITEGDSATLSWSASNATTVTIDQGIGDVGGAGSTGVSPAETTVYTITASNSYGWASRSIALTVNSAGGIFIPPIGPLFILGPDLIITDVWNNNGTIWYTVENQGVFDAPASHTKLYVDGSLKATDNVNPLDAGDSRNEKFAGYSYTCSGFNDEIKVTADVNDAVNESEEDNNSLKETWLCQIVLEPIEMVPLFPGP